ncbi:MAG: serine/threonine-protein kinase, partial [Planctomycetota bacterium]
MSAEDAATPEDSAADSSSAASPEDLVGHTLGDYRVVRRLGAGGMAEVFLAEQVSLKRQVALKILRADAVAGADESLISRFEQEATAAANLSHPNIVQVYSIGRENDLHYIAQEFVDGPTAGELVRKKGPFELAAALRLMRQVASALRAASAEGIVHRDIKPENILISRKGAAKVADFGLARLESNEQRQSLTRSGMTMGTPLYMSPEQVSGKPTDTRTDLYSLGVSAYHLLTGSPPFRGETAVAIAVKHLNETAPSLKSKRPDLPPALSTVLERLMAKKPEQRYADAESLLRDLQYISREVKERPDTLASIRLPSGSAPPPATPETPQSDLDLPAGRQAVRLLMPLAVAIAAGVGLGIFFRPADPFATPAPGGVAKAASVRDQYWRAIDNPADRAGWRAIIEHYPDDAVFVREAEFRLAVLALATHEHDRASRAFAEVSRLADDNPAMRNSVRVAEAVIAVRD